MKAGCKKNYHFTCALKAKALFIHSKKVYCCSHKHSAYCDSRALTTAEHFNAYSSRTRHSHTCASFDRLSNAAVSAGRRVQIAPRGSTPAALDVKAEDARCAEAAAAVRKGGRLCLRIGALSVLQFGRIVFTAAAFHSRNAIYPVGYRAIRRFWTAPPLASDLLLPPKGAEANDDEAASAAGASDSGAATTVKPS